ncbi:MAG: glutamine synthetase [Thermoleophilaceae bacterium]|jgi:glutamine synthetase|nr:glutamine synthetase [Thermoleophilaceae bacterium]MDQ3241348.1 glutamine synthetase family protein [Actinomycetota bacterium]
MPLSEPDGDYVMRTVRERDVRFVRMWFVDVIGLLKSFAIPVSELEEALEEGVGIDGSSLDGGERGAERDAIAHPDPRSFQILPWRPESLVARMFCDVRLPGGEPFPSDCRFALRRTLERAAELGFAFQVGPEIEFFLFSAGEEGVPKPLDDGAYFDLTSLDTSSDFRRRTIEHLEQMSIPVKASHHEVAPSQHEIDLGHTDALSTADAITTFRLAVREVARELGVFASFMPKPLQEQAGSGMHLHLSLFREGQNAFYAEDAPLSKTGRAFLAGVLAHAGALTAVTNQWVNSYKRLASGFEAPSTISWTRASDGALVRVPSNRPRKEGAARIELRSPDPACNPYLALTLLLAAGLEGVERELEPPSELASDGSPPPADLPRDLREATDLLASSELAREALGDDLLEVYLRSRRSEWDAHQAEITEFERKRLLRAL